MSETSSQASSLYSNGYTGKLHQKKSRRSESASSQKSLTEAPLIAAEPNVLQIMTKYANVSIPADFSDNLYFTIHIKFEDKIYPVSVPNPRVFPRKKYCCIWPFEVKHILGFTGTMQDLWIEPDYLVPLGSSNTESIYFASSARLRGAVAINASLLEPEGLYELVCNDRRSDAKTDLTDDELEQINTTFENFDMDHNGCIDRLEVEEMIRQRMQERENIIEEKFQEALAESCQSEEDAQLAEDLKQQHLQHLHESCEKMLSLFDAADVNGDGVLSYDEFVLAEAWWIRCTLNPEHAHLF